MNAVNESAKTTFFHILNYLESQNFPPDVLQPLALHLNRNLNFRELDSDGNLIQTQMDEAFFQWRKKSQPQLLNEIIENNDFGKKKEKNRNRLLSKPKKRKEDIFAKFQLLKSVLGHRSFTDENEFTHSSVFNLLYDKTGTKLVTADEDGLIKIWGSEDGALKLTLKSHKAMINSIDISPCNKYLASCANDGCVRVWDLETGKPITVFRQILGEKLLILFFIQWMDSKNEEILVLVCASEEGNIYILDARDWVLQPYYPKFTKLSSNHLFVNETGIMTPKKICCIDYHDNGYLSVGTLPGDIIIFDTLKNWTNFGGNHQMLKSCVWSEHKKSCHLTVWAKDGSKLISASFDGTAKIWKWNPLSFSANIQKRSDYTIFFDSSKTHDAKCWSVNFSCKGRYAMASFSKKSRKKNETGQLMTNLQIFDCKSEKVIHTLDSKTTPIEMNQFIYIIEPHPTLDHIAFSADYIGQIALWDISKGQVLNYFQEKGFYFNYPDLSLPCLDGRFSPDGFSLAVSTFYGSFSLYGYGNRENYDYTPNEQFFESDFKRFEIDQLGRVIDSENGAETDQGSGGVCNHLKNVYPLQLKNIEDSNEGKVEERYERLLFYYKMNEFLRNLMQKYLDESDQTRLLILSKQKKSLSLPPIPSRTEAQPLSAATLQQIPRQITNLSALNAPSETSDLSALNLRNDNRNRRLKRLIRRNQNINNNYQERGNDLEEDKSNEENDDIKDRNMRESRRTTNNSNNNNNRNNRNSRYNTTNTRNNPSFSDKDNNMNGEQDDEEDESWQEDFSVSECHIKNLRNGNGRRNRIQTRSSHVEQRPIKKVRLSEDDSDNGSPLATLATNSRRHNLRQKRINYFHEAEDEDDFIDNSPIPAKRKRERKEDNSFKKNFFEREKEKEKINSLENEKEMEKNEDNLKRTSHFNTIDKEYEPRKKVKINNENALELGNSAVEGLCDRCKFHNAKSKCSGISCELKFCLNCHSCRLISKNEKFFCIECYLKISKSKSCPASKEFNREWLNFDDQSEDNYIPQIGDSVYYLFQAYEEFIMNYFEILPFSEFSPSIYPFLDDNRLFDPVLCEVKDISFIFSLPKNKNATILAFITLQYDQFNFRVGYNNINGKSFLVSKEIFECSRDVGKMLKETMIVNYFKEGEIKNAQIIEVSAKEDVFPISPYNTIKILGFEEEGYNFRPQSRNNQNNVNSNKISERVCFWDIKSYGMPNNMKKIDYKSLTPQLSQERSKEIIDFIKKYIANNSGQTIEFIDAVDDEAYPDYLCLIAFPIYLNRIITRLENGYYRRESSLKFDVSIIEANAETYNQSPSCIITYAKKICDDIKDFIDGKLRRTRGRIRNDERKDEYYEFFRLDSRNRSKEEKNDDLKRATRSIRNKFN